VSPEQQAANGSEDLAIDIFRARRMTLTASVDGRGSRLQGPAPAEARGGEAPPLARRVSRGRLSRLPSIDVIVVGALVVLALGIEVFVAIATAQP
jgi:hypothetical protein